MERKGMEQTKKRKRDDKLPCCDMFQAPIRIKFRPTEEVLLSHYLLHRAAAKTTLLDGFMPDFELYGSATEVWDLFGGPKLEQITTSTEGELDMYFFTHLEKKSNAKKDGKNCIRTVGSSTWGAIGKAEQVFDDEGCQSCLGSRKRFKYINKKHPDQNGQWTMLELSLEGSSMLNLPTDFVLCGIHKKQDKNMLEVPRRLGKEIVLGAGNGTGQINLEVLGLDEGDAVLSVDDVVCILDHISEPEQVDQVCEKETLVSSEEDGKEAGSEVDTEAASLAKELLDWDPSDITEEELLNLQQSKCYESFFHRKADFN